MDIQFVDYDNVRFHLSTPESKSSIMLSMGIQCWPDLVKYGARQHLEQELGGYLLAEGDTEPEYDVSLVINLEQLPQSPGTLIASQPLACGLPLDGVVLTSRGANSVDQQTRPLQIHRHVFSLPGCV